MASRYSILKFAPNPLSGEAIAVGVLLFQEGESFFRWSTAKLRFCKELHASAAKLLQLAIRDIQAFLGEHMSAEQKGLLYKPAAISPELLQRFARYHNGILRFSEPLYLHQRMDRNRFEAFFAQVVGPGFAEEAAQQKKRAQPGLQRQVSGYLRKKLYGQVDLNLTVHPQQLPQLYFDFTLDAAGLNGQAQVIKAIDFNRYKTSEPVEKLLSEYEIFAKRLENFLHDRDKVVTGPGNYWLIADPYTGQSTDLRELHQMVAHGATSLKVTQSGKLEEVTDFVIHSKARPLAEAFEKTS